ncbi:formate/nitrite transporter family protein [Dokdonella immobilis]|uniref:Formate/nitrite transporter FocA, FNT family n=1 Tax=Dokdonella immobilis TaxID=578942 RepID=A0A1I4VT89_9GAMM|nr:formate/nitrite transporter family protein [Dokdonella immobilis]SFN04518.1 Formate/nitrite transporter FocA, FNT family [Dokdonella immobilis]
MSTRKPSTKGPGQAAKAETDETIGESFALSPDEASEVEESRPPRVQVLHETIRRQGEEELHRSATALAWSALAAGLSMGFSMLARALLRTHLPEASGGFLIENFGYTIGFLIVILARQQLFTENTITAVLPVMTVPSLGTFARLLRLWGIVLVGNLVGVALFAYGVLHMQVVDEPVRTSIADLGTGIMHNVPWQMFTKGIVAGWLIATMVWLLPGAGTSRALIVLLVTYLVGIGGFTHIIVGSTEVLYLVFLGQATFASYLFDFALPTLAGNIVGGSVIFALISHAQVRSDD